MEVNKSYIEFLLKLLNNEENLDINKYQEELIVNLYLTLLSLSNLDYTDDIDLKENEIISDFLRKLNNLKVKIQLKRKKEELTKIAKDLISQYHDNINILAIYIKDGNELENVINTMDAKNLTKLIDKVTKDKMNKEYSKEERNIRRSEIVKLLPTNEYYIEQNTIFIKNNNLYEKITTENFIDMFSYLLNPDNYKKTYKNKTNQKTHDLIVDKIIKILLDNKITQEELNTILIPILLTYILSLNVNKCENLDASDFNIENIKITELYSFASEQSNNIDNNKTTKWRNISIPNEYLLEKIKEMIRRGMYYNKDDNFILEHIENNTSDFKISIKTEGIKQFLKIILEAN